MTVAEATVALVNAVKASGMTREEFEANMQANLRAWYGRANPRPAAK